MVDPVIVPVELALGAKVTVEVPALKAPDEQIQLRLRLMDPLPEKVTVPPLMIKSALLEIAEPAFIVSVPF